MAYICVIKATLTDMIWLVLRIPNNTNNSICSVGTIKNKHTLITNIHHLKCMLSSWLQGDLRHNKRMCNRREYTSGLSARFNS